MLGEGEGRGCRPAQGLLLLLKLLFRAVANRVDKVPVSLLACSAVERVNFLRKQSPHPCPVFKATMGLVFKNIERDLPLSIK